MIRRLLWAEQPQLASVADHVITVQPPPPPETRALYISKNWRGMMHYLAKNLRATGAKKNKEKLGETYGKGMLKIGGILPKVVGSSLTGKEHQLERDYHDFDPRASKKKKYSEIKDRDEREAFLYGIKKEDRFMKHFASMLERSGYRLIRKQDVAHARVHSFHRFRFDVRYAWLESALITRIFHHLRMEPDKTPDDLPFNGSVLMFVRGDGEISTTGYFYLDKFDSIIHRISDSMYFVLMKAFPITSRFLYPDIDDWTAAYKSKLRQSEFIPDRLDVKDQLLLSWRSLRTLLGSCTLRERTYKSVVCLYRRKRAAQSLDANTHWRTGGQGFNDKNIEIQQYSHVPLTDIQVLLPEKTVRQKPMDILGLASMCAVITNMFFKIYTVGSVFTLSQLALFGACSGYMMRLVGKWRFAQIRYTHSAESMRAKNHQSTGAVTLLKVSQGVATQMIKQALLVYYCLLKADLEGVTTTWWDATELDTRIYNTLVEMSPREAENYMYGIMPMLVTDERDIGGLGLWSWKSSGYALGLHPHPPATAIENLKDKWAASL
eukprot:TRINITY_DN230_c0_g2_i1.p1 TRINITY_DN230_c0_g2~~TRINITY_DN230_c0_g2_i1.p1  ORF type:complete len:549 (+),score=52.95 TRINITY_DN230_c0_g2_i1:1403-3049(+)